MSDKAVITCALNGVLTDPKQHHVPVTPEEMAREAKAALASRAISSGVTGTWCCFGSVSTPFSAQVMTAVSLMGFYRSGCGGTFTA